MERIISSKNLLVQDDALLKFLLHSVQFVYNPINATVRQKAIPDLVKVLPELYQTFYFLLVLAGVPYTSALYERKRLFEIVYNCNTTKQNNPLNPVILLSCQKTITLSFHPFQRYQIRLEVF